MTKKASHTGAEWEGFKASPGSYLRSNPEYVLAPALFVLLMAVWYLSTRLFDIPVFVLPTPGAVAKSLWLGLTSGVSSPQAYYYHAAYTVFEAFSGFLVGSLIGIVLGVLVAHFRLVERTLYPYIVAFQALPKVAIAPLFVIWFGFGLMPKVVVTTIVTFFPLLVNTITGCRTVDPERLDLARSLKATKWQIFEKITFPSALPYIFAGLHMATVLSIIGAIVGEFVGAERGLGVLILQANSNMDIAGAYAVFFVLSGIGIVAHLLMRALERKVCFWAERSDQAIGM